VITVILSAYNAEKFIEKSIDSVLNQVKYHINMLKEDDEKYKNNPI